jgi:hypothetical protein
MCVAPALCRSRYVYTRLTVCLRQFWVVTAISCDRVCRTWHLYTADHALNSDIGANSAVLESAGRLHVTVAHRAVAGGRTHGAHQAALARDGLAARCNNSRKRKIHDTSDDPCQEDFSASATTGEDASDDEQPPGKRHKNM